DAEKKLWLGLMETGIWRRENADQWSRVSVRPDRPDCSPTILQRDADGGLWVTCREDGSLAHFADGRAEVFRPDRGPNVGPVGLVRPDAHGVTFGGEFGLSLYDRNGFHTLRTERVPELSFVTGVVEAEGRTWVQAQGGILRFDTADLERALVDPDAHPTFDLFDREDGLPGDAQQDTGINTAQSGPDGKLWFITNRGMVWIDPQHLYRNTVPPPVAIRSVTVGGRTETSPTDMHLAAGTSSLQIDYAALSFVEPRRVRFRYKLEGVDADWVDPGARRQAFYTRLGPGDYRFHVTASNNDGVWNTAGASLAFSIPPTFVQSRWFLALCLVAGALALWALYGLRLRQVSTRIRERLEERIAERERIARELHDTLLQGFQGVMLHVRSVGEQIPKDLPAQALLSGVLERAEDVLVEGRDRVRNLRAAAGKGDLAQSLAGARSWHRHDPGIRFQVTVEGSPRALHPIVEEEVRRIGEEAISNAFQHARAANIDAGIAYDRHELVLRVQDDGVGIDASLLGGNGKEGHFGLTGMRERAEKIRGEIRFESRRGAGTEIQLTVPARVAYADSAPRRFGFTLGRRSKDRD
ncbi:MAG TPA: triple tyrosine motif-containing protein, partial [Rhodanobacteraceae bacterium]|nr:triple tyrosine motif-containing protein [Rhodanobacteraceae bacterium]